jgi:cytochrome c biogenesis protein CcdA
VQERNWLKNFNMNRQNETIKKILKSRMVSLDDEQFTDRIIDSYLKSKRSIERKVLFDSRSLILGIIFSIGSIGLGLIISSDIEIGLNMQHAAILFSLSVIFLIIKFIGEITTPNAYTKNSWQKGN